VSGRRYGNLDPRLGQIIKRGGTNGMAKSGRVVKCLFYYPQEERAKPSLMYNIMFEDGTEETWTLKEVDRALSAQGILVPRVRCVQAVAESSGYGFGIDAGLPSDIVPVPLNPNVADAASQVALSSSVFRDTINASATLLIIDPREMTGPEWLRLLVLLVMKCSSSDVIQTVVTEMENEAAERMAESASNVGQVKAIYDILPSIGDEDSSEPKKEDESTHSVALPITVGLEMSSTIKTPSRKGSPAPSAAVVVDAGSVQVLDEMDVDAAPETGGSSDIAKPIAEKETPFKAAFAEKEKRQKMIEEGFCAYVIKNQIRPTVASFEEDTVSQIADSVLTPKEDGLQFSNLRCRRTLCSFCGLSDVALGLPLVRVPNEEEWNEFMPHMARSRRTHLVAEMPASDTTAEEVNAHSQRLLSVTIRFGGKLVSSPDEDLKAVKDGGILEFLPRSELRFQDELKFHSESGIPFVSGSLSAHECCARAAHKARKQDMVRKHKEHEAELTEKEAGLTCGRTLEIGRDNAGRSFWKFFGDDNALFVCVEETDGASPPDMGSGIWHRFGDPESVASVIVCLGNDPVVKDLRRLYPAADQMIEDKTWSDRLLKKRFPNVAKLFSDEANTNRTERDRMEVDELAYSVGESVLVESKSNRQFWDAHVVDVSIRQFNSAAGGSVITAYRVQYESWGDRYVEWVKANRVFDPSDDNRSRQVSLRSIGWKSSFAGSAHVSSLSQEEMIVQRAVCRYGLPTSLNQLIAKDYLSAKDRVRGTAALPDFARIAYAGAEQSIDERTFATMKAALLAIEAALPLGSIDDSDSGPWRPLFAKQWRLIVLNSKDPEVLMRAVIVLEDAISEQWLKEDVGHLRSCLSARWKAVAEATPSTLALRIILLDRAIMYGNVDRKRFAKKKKKNKVGRPKKP
jgi:hypothetical protein